MRSCAGILRGRSHPLALTLADGRHTAHILMPTAPRLPSSVHRPRALCDTSDLKSEELWQTEPPSEYHLCIHPELEFAPKESCEPHPWEPNAHDFLSGLAPQ